MWGYGVVALCLLGVGGVWGGYEFPAEFQFGAASAAFQIEGAWNVSDKTASVWDNWLHRAGSEFNGDVTCNSYNQWQEDVEAAAALGLDYYRFSLSWPRLLPTGLPNEVSEDGVQYYNQLIDGLLARGIEPVVTIYHWDLPQNLQDLGGWANPLIGEWFADYARVAYSKFGDRVRRWLTINEPFSFCVAGYDYAMHPPGMSWAGVADYICIKNVLLAHARAWRVYDEEFRNKYHGKVALCNHMVWIEAEEDDDGTAELVRQIYVGLFNHPIFSKKGGWPPAIEQIIEKNSKEQGYPRSRLPSFTKDEIKLVRGTFDFLAMNHYTSRVGRHTREGESALTYVLGLAEVDGVLYTRPEWRKAGTSWFYIYYEGMRKQLKWLKDNYGDVEILITENGYGDADGLKIQDDERITYISEMLKQVLLAMHEDGVRVVGYTVWSLLDNLEWDEGFTPRFGLYQVDFDDAALARVPRASASYYAGVITSRSAEYTNTTSS
ncbi:myrosinase 1-like [Aricia agestis]|uniref:myrosinase 1-like n=1 Tax=Aricia agestis TaxID=91739 RepID=UPI001C20206C|nr:myrosinase 1-like [Aricia agestis]